MDAPPRRPIQFWKVFNDWWRAELDRLGRRPVAAEINKWYEAHAHEVWPEPERPTAQETRVHAKCLRSISAVRVYFRKYRAIKRRHSQGVDTDGGEDDSEDYTPQPARAASAPVPPSGGPAGPQAPSGAPGHGKRKSTGGGGQQKQLQASSSAVTALHFHPTPPALQLPKGPSFVMQHHHSIHHSTTVTSGMAGLPPAKRMALHTNGSGTGLTGFVGGMHTHHALVTSASTTGSPSIMTAAGYRPQQQQQQQQLAVAPPSMMHRMPIAVGSSPSTLLTQGCSENLLDQPTSAAGVVRSARPSKGGSNTAPLARGGTTRVSESGAPQPAPGALPAGVSRLGGGPRGVGGSHGMSAHGNGYGLPPAGPQRSQAPTPCGVAPPGGQALTASAPARTPSLPAPLKSEPARSPLPVFQPPVGPFRAGGAASWPSHMGSGTVGCMHALHGGLAPGPFTGAHSAPQLSAMPCLLGALDADLRGLLSDPGGAGGSAHHPSAVFARGGVDGGTLTPCGLSNVDWSSGIRTPDRLQPYGSGMPGDLAGLGVGSFAPNGLAAGNAVGLGGPNPFHPQQQQAQQQHFMAVKPEPGAWAAGSQAPMQLPFSLLGPGPVLQRTGSNSFPAETAAPKHRLHVGSDGTPQLRAQQPSPPMLRTDGSGGADPALPPGTSSAAPTASILGGYSGGGPGLGHRQPRDVSHDGSRDSSLQHSRCEGGGEGRAEVEEQSLAQNGTSAGGTALSNVSGAGHHQPYPDTSGGTGTGTAQPSPALPPDASLLSCGGSAPAPLAASAHRAERMLPDLHPGWRAAWTSHRPPPLHVAPPPSWTPPPPSMQAGGWGVGLIGTKLTTDGTLTPLAHPPLFQHHTLYAHGLDGGMCDSPLSQLLRMELDGVAAGTHLPAPADLAQHPAALPQPPPPGIWEHVLCPAGAAVAGGAAACLDAAGLPPPSHLPSDAAGMGALHAQAPEGADPIAWVLDGGAGAGTCWSGAGQVPPRVPSTGPLGEVLLMGGFPDY